MKIIKCKKCGSTDLSVSIDASPNEQLSFAALYSQGCATDKLYCKDCREEVQPDTQEIEDIRKFECDQFDLWLKGLADMFVVWHGHFKRDDHTPIAFGHEIFYAAHRAEAWAQDYIEKCCLTPGGESYHCFAIRYFNPKVEVREKLYPTEAKIRAIDVNV